VRRVLSLSAGWMRPLRAAPLRRAGGALLATGLLVMGPLFGEFGSLQGQDPLTLQVNPSTGGVQVAVGPVLETPGLRSALESGLPIRVHLVTELWRDRFFDALEGRHEWRGTIRFDPLSELFRVESGDGPVGVATTLESAARLLRNEVQVPLRPPRPGRYYYLGRLEVETLSLSDLEELRRWLQGDLGRAGDEDREVGGAILQGLRRLFVRTLGLPVQRHQARSSRFDWEG